MFELCVLMYSSSTVSASIFFRRLIVKISRLVVLLFCLVCDFLVVLIVLD